MTSIARPQTLPRTMTIPNAALIITALALIGALTLIVLSLMPPDIANPGHLLPGAPDLALRNLV